MWKITFHLNLISDHKTYLTVTTDRSKLHFRLNRNSFPTTFYSPWNIWYKQIPSKLLISSYYKIRGVTALPPLKRILSPKSIIETSTRIVWGITSSSHLQVPTSSQLLCDISIGLLQDSPLYSLTSLSRDPIPPQVLLKTVISRSLSPPHRVSSFAHQTNTYANWTHEMRCELSAIPGVGSIDRLLLQSVPLLRTVQYTWD